MKNEEKITMKARCAIISGQIFFIWNPKYLRRLILQRLGLKKNTFAYNIFATELNDCFGNSVNLRLEYLRFYKHEFISFSDYLENKYILSKEETKMFDTPFSFKSENSRRVFFEDSFYSEEDISQVFWDSVGGKLEYED